MDKKDEADFKLKWHIAKEVLKTIFGMDINNVYFDREFSCKLLMDDVFIFYSTRAIAQIDPDKSFPFDSSSNYVKIKLKDAESQVKEFFLDNFLCKGLCWSLVKCQDYFVKDRDGNYCTTFKSSSIDDACAQLGKSKEELLIDIDLNGIEV